MPIIHHMIAQHVLQQLQIKVEKCHWLFMFIRVGTVQITRHSQSWKYCSENAAQPPKKAVLVCGYNIWGDRENTIKNYKNTVSKKKCISNRYQFAPEGVLIKK